MPRLRYTESGRLILETFLEQSDEEGICWYAKVMLALSGLSPADSGFPLVLARPQVWDRVIRDQIRRGWSGDRTFFDWMKIGGGAQFTDIARTVEELAARDKAPVIDEYYFALYLREVCTRQVGEIRVDPVQLLEGMKEHSGRRDLPTEDIRKTWCFCDTNVFLHYRFFNEVDWARELGVEHAVLVLPAPVLTELDFFRSDSANNRARKRARAVLPALDRLARTVPPGQPAPVRERVELLLQYREPRAFSADLDPSLVDDCLVAAACEFQWLNRGGQVLLLSGDLGPRWKARGQELRDLDVPQHLRLQGEQEQTELSSGGQ